MPTEPAESEPAPSGPTRGAAAVGASGPTASAPAAGIALVPGLPALRAGSWLLLAVNLALAAVAYRALLLPGERAMLPIESEIEGWFFYPSHTVPGVILLLSAWLLYRRRERLLALDPMPGPFWLVGILSLAGIATLGWATYTESPDLVVFSLLFNGFGLAALFAGLPGMRTVLIPVGFLLFAATLPSPALNVVLFELQVGTADLTGWLLHRLGITAFVTGDQILVPGQIYAVVENCSGLRSVETLTMLSILLLDLFRRTGLHAAIIILAAPVLAFLLNGARALTLILNPHSEVVAIHNVQGIAIILVGLTLIYLLDEVLARFLPRREAPGRSPAKGVREGAPAAKPSSRGPIAAATVILFLTAGVSLLAPVWAEPQPQRVPFGEPRFTEPAGWTSQFIDVDRAFLGRAHYRQMLHRRYRKGAEAVDLFVGVGDGSLRRYSPFSRKASFPSGGWLVEEAGVLALDGSDGISPREVQTQLIRTNTRLALVWFWYEDGQGLPREVLRAFLALDRSPFRRERDAMAVRLSTRLESPGPEALGAARERLRGFYELVAPALAAR